MSTTGLGRIRVDTRVGHRRGDRHPVPAAATGSSREGLRAGGAETEFLPLPSPQGHDAFLVDIDAFRPRGSRFPCKPAR